MTDNNNNKQVSFNDYVDTYQKEIQSSIGFIGQDVDFFIMLKAEKLIELSKKYFDKPAEIKLLDVGSGIGLIDHALKNFFTNINGVDVEEGVVEKAKLHNPEVKYSVYDGKRLPFADNEMDMAFTINVMHHIVPSEHSVFLDEMKRVVKKGGLVAVIEHNPYNPLTQIAVKRCKFDRDAILIKQNKMIKMLKSKGLSLVEKSYIVFFPFKKSFYRGIEKSLGWIPFGAQYYILTQKND